MVGIQQIVFIIVLATAVDGFFLNWLKPRKSAKVPAKKWSDFHVTFKKFTDLPETSKEAEDDGWTKTASCGASSYFNGNRYVLNNDKSTMALYDYNGDIAGMQFGIAKSLATDLSFKNKRHWNEEKDSLVITAYFTHPSGICNGRTEDNLYIQVGNSSDDVMRIPYLESDLGSTLWVKGKCFFFMGQHYWYNISKEMSCDDSFPVFLLYHKGKLTGFGWAVIADLNTTSRVEHPTPSELGYFFESKTQPKCLDTAGALTTQHIYLKKYPLTILCNPFKNILSG